MENKKEESLEGVIRFMTIDDNYLDALILQEYAKPYPFLELIGSYTDPAQFMESIKTNSPDLLFLDIEIPGFTGIELLKQVRKTVPMAVFITSHPEFAIEGFELSALDYIVKPLKAERFAQCVSRIKEYWQMRKNAKAYEVLFERDALTIKDGHRVIKLPQHEIIYLEAMQDYTKLVTEKKQYLTLASLGNFLEKIPGDYFMRVHRSYAVAVDKIQQISNAGILCGNVNIPVGKTYKPLLANIKL